MKVKLILSNSVLVCMRFRIHRYEVAPFLEYPRSSIPHKPAPKPMLVSGIKFELFTVFLRFCGSKLPHPLIATESTMLLVFKSDASVQRKVINPTIIINTENI